MYPLRPCISLAPLVISLRRALLIGCTSIATTMLSACADRAATEAASEPMAVTAARVAERYLTLRDDRDNVDSVAVWHDPAGADLLIATAKDTDVLVIYDAASGERLERIGSSGTAPGQFRRPNGIIVQDDLLFVIERDNARVQVLALPGFDVVGMVGDGQLQRPYGGWVHAPAPGEYLLFVTDNYEDANEQIPPPAELGRRVHRYALRVDTGVSGRTLVDARLDLVFGDTDGSGVLHKVESIFGDPLHGRLLIADELETQNNLKVYDFNGRFAGTTVGDGVFRFEPEGIALYACDDGSGIWFTTDQSRERNYFHLFDRTSLAYLASFEGARTMNTDGVWLTRQALPGFPLGVLHAVHDDGNVAAFDLGDVLAATGVSGCGERR